VNKQNKTTKQVFAKKSFGQNFLVDGSYIEKIIAELNPLPDETIIEIGPGRGALTRRLLDKAGKVIAIELDKDLIPVLQSEFGGQDNFQLIEADALAVDFSEITHAKRIKLVANLPYYISTAILQKLIKQRECFSELVLMLQREVVERITAEPGNSERGYLSVLVEAYTTAEKLFDVPPTAFRPVPKVWSSVVRLEIIQNEDKKLSEIKETALLQVVSAGFAQKRKTIFNNLKNSPPALQQMFTDAGGIERVLAAAGVESKRRAETLTVDEWNQIADFIV
jgi:16S rRNA (adenine1518-N6/adenine1519-N6)-dimethyltransferase